MLARSSLRTCVLPSPSGGTRLQRTPTSPPLAPRPLPATSTPRWRTPAPGSRAPHGAPRRPPRSREGAAPGSDGQSGRPIEPGTASQKGGSGGSDWPNERGARVGLPPGIPLARIAGPWVTRKLGGRWRRPRLRSPVSETGPPSPKPGRGSRPPPSHSPPRAARRGAAWSPAPFVGRAPPLGGNKVAQWEPPRGGGERQRRDSERRRGQPGQKVGRREQGRRHLRTGARTGRSEVCGGPPPGPRHSRRHSLAKVWRRRLPRRRRWLHAPRRAEAERAPLPLRPSFCVSRLLLMLRPATSCGGRC
ncbi:hypothetical protein J1605_017136 [Eschrichtius robustus]|uniref:Uncharacterized protein n=1 Tax=Eschrichtius robustus TaxID=9764 RepID=A0AB34I2N6_ESCRO|nr:hypothetical protein J1605_017136 [Eschrichtius robustus]